MKIKSCSIIIVLLIKVSSYSQIHERWDVKTLSDGFIPDTNNVTKITVAEIEAIHRTKVTNTEPRQNFEKKVVRITGTIKRIRFEKGTSEKPGDMDYHIEITDGTGSDSTFVCEAVDNSDRAARTSPYISDFEKVRELVVNLKVGDIVTFTGVLFQDKYHHPSPLRTRNFIEMHPILKAIKIIDDYTFLIEVIPLILASIILPDGLPSRSTSKMKRG